MSQEPLSAGELEHNALRNALYHTARRQRLEFWSRLLNFLVIVGGASTVAQMATEGGFGMWIGFAITIVGALQLVFDFAGRAKNHEILQRRYYDLLGRIKEAGGDLPVKVRSQIMGEIARISGEEPPTLRALDAVAYNEATNTIHGDAGAIWRLPITPWQSFTKHFLHHNGVPFDRPDVPPAASN